MTDETRSEEPTTRKRRKRHKPDEIVRKLRDADAMLNAGKDLTAVLQKLEVTKMTNPTRGAGSLYRSQIDVQRSHIDPFHSSILVKSLRRT